MSKAPASARKGAAAPAAEGAAKAGGGRRKIMLIGVIVVSLLAGGAGLYFAMFAGDKAETAAEDGHGEAAPETGAEPAAGGHGTTEAAAESHPPGAEGLYELKDMTLNIRGFNSAGAPIERLIRVSMTIVYDADALGRAKEQAPGGGGEESGGGHGGGEAAPGPQGVDAMIPHLRDVFLDYLRQITTRDLDGSLGFATVKAELLKRAKAVMGPDVPREILIRDLVVQ
ncbi:flagellar basal body-associated FliL family protein [Frigidibacter sp. MR17.14]|uniref:flagellar basal body-associated FliL family protein n=1 Tax=Frigidibacter sp. MR17.14 TaxID=3126509 RepID=UPI003012AC02